MPVSALNGLLTASVGSEHTVASLGAGGVYVFAVDVNAMVNGDRVELRVYGKARSADTERVTHVSVFEHSQARMLKQTEPYITDSYVRCTIKQSSGVSRSFPWNLLQV